TSPPLIAAVINQQPEIVAMLLKAGAEVNKGSEENGGPLHYAIEESNSQEGAEILRLLTKAGADVNAKEPTRGLTPLMLSLDSKELTATTTFLIESGADVNAKAAEGFTPLMVTAVAGDLNRLHLLLKRGARVNERAENGLTALMLAIENKHRSVVQALLEAGADPEIQDKNNNSAIDRAIWVQDSGILEELGKTKSSTGSFTDYVAKRRRNFELLKAVYAKETVKVRQLLTAGAEIESRDPK